MEIWLRALVAGLFCGFVVSIPVGPVNLTVVNRALRRGFLTAFLVGLGAICAETLYASLMLAGHASIFDKPLVRDLLRAGAVVVIAVLGVHSLLAKPEEIEKRGFEAAAKVDRRWHHPRSFLMGFILTISNLMLVILWASLGALLVDRELVVPTGPSRTLCIVGVFAGGALWFLLLAFSVSRAHRRVSPQTLTRLVRASGVLLLLFDLVLAYKWVWPLLHRPPGG